MRPSIEAPSAWMSVTLMQPGPLVPDVGSSGTAGPASGSVTATGGERQHQYHRDHGGRGADHDHESPAPARPARHRRHGPAGPVQPAGGRHDRLRSLRPGSTNVCRPGKTFATFAVRYDP